MIHTPSFVVWSWKILVWRAIWPFPLTLPLQPKENRDTPTPRGKGKGLRVEMGLGQSVPSKRTGSWDEVYSIWSSSVQTDRRLTSKYCEIRKNAEPSALCSSRGALMSYSDRSAWCCFKSNRERDFGQTHSCLRTCNFSLSPPRPVLVISQT